MSSSTSLPKETSKNTIVTKLTKIPLRFKKFKTHKINNNKDRKIKKFL